MIPEGKYKCRGVEGALVTVGQNNTEAVQVIVEITQDGPHKGDRLRWDGWLTDKTAQRTMESLRHLGWETDRLDDLRGLGTREAVAVIEHEEKDGKKYARVQWINSATGGARISEEQKVSSVEAKAMADRFAAMARGTRAKSAGPTTTGNAAPPATKAPPPQGFADDDIPF